MSTNAMHRVYNFSPGPATLPLPVLEKVREEFLSLRGRGISIVELSHRDKLFLDILAEAKEHLATLLGIPTNYRILFLQGGSRLQFAMVPMNLATPDGVTQYLLTGSWGKYAFQEAQKFSQAQLAWDGTSDNFTATPATQDWQLDPQAAYVHFTSNETIQGVQFSETPDSHSVPLVCDMSSDFLSRPVPIDRYGLIYACAKRTLDRRV